MTIAATPRRSPVYTGNGVATTYAFAFKVLDAATVVVTVADANDLNSVVLVNGVDYTVTLNPDQDASPGGEIGYAGLPVGHRLVITSATDASQPTALTTLGQFHANVIEAALDRIVILHQQQQEQLDRCVKVVATSEQDPTTLLDTAVTNASNSASAAAASALAASNSASAAAASEAAAAGLFTGTGANLVGYTPSGTGARARTTASKLDECISVLDFIPSAEHAAIFARTSTYDCTLDIQAAIDEINARGGGRLFFPRGVYITGKLTVYSHVWLIGEGRSNTTLKLKDGANTDLIYGNGADALWGTSSTGGIENVGLFDLTLDGNRANNLTSGSCVALYGNEFYFENLFVTNARDYGIRTEWYFGDSTFGMESHYSNIRIDGAGKDGWLNNGPHDAVTENLIVIDASLNADKTYSGIEVGANMTGRFIGCHVWNRAASNRHKYALRLAPGGGGSEFLGCHFEGAWNANVSIESSNNLFDAACRFYSAWNGTNVFVSGTAKWNTIKGWLGEPGGGRPACVGVVLGYTAGDDVSYNDIDVQCVRQEGGNVQFTAAATVASNKVKAYCYNATAVSIVGSIPAGNEVDVVVKGPTPARVNNVEQQGYLTVPAGSGATFNFTHPFASNPWVEFSPIGPSGSLTSGMWISALTTTSVTIFNNNAVQTDVNILARAA